MVLESHHISLGKSDLNTAGFMFLATCNCTCCLLKMALEAPWSINSSTFIFSTQRKGHVCRSLCCYGVDGPHELLLSQLQSAALSVQAQLMYLPSLLGSSEHSVKHAKGVRELDSYLGSLEQST